MPSTDQWVQWADTNARRAFPDAWSHDHFLWLGYTSGVLRTLRDRPADASGASWSRVNELGEADHYYFSRTVIACALGLGYMGPPAYASSPVMQRFLGLIEAGCPSAADEVLRSGLIDGHDIDMHDRFALLLHTLRAAPRSLIGGVAAVCWALIIPMWELLKEIGWEHDSPWVVPGGDGASSAPSLAAMGWAYRGIADALTDDAPFSHQFRFSDPRRIEGLAESDFTAALAALPAGAAPSSEHWGLRGVPMPF
ncbi:MAG: hypothetical protein ABI671_07545 [Burkholderiales bacterium]